MLLLVVKLQALACNFLKSDTPPLVFSSFFKLYKWYQIAQRIINAEYFVQVFFIDNYVFY